MYPEHVNGLKLSNFMASVSEIGDVVETEWQI